MDSTVITGESFKESVLPAFVEGLHSLESVADTLQSSTDLRQCIEKVQQLLESSHRSLSKAEQSSLEQVEALSKDVQERMDMIRGLSRQQENVEDRKESLKQQLEGLYSLESVARDQLQAAQRAFANAREGLDGASHQLQEAHQAKQTAVGLFFIPLAGLIAGGIMLAKAEEAIRNAQHAVDGARQSFSNQHDNLRRCESELKSIRANIKITMNDVETSARNIQDIQQDINRESALQERVLNFLIPLRTCTQFLGTFAGRTRMTSVLNDLIATLDGLLPVLNEIVEALSPLIERSSDYQLLLIAELPVTISKLKEANKKIKLAVDSKNSELQDFI